MKSLTALERLAVLESQVEELKHNTEQTNEKLDELLALKNKGAGALKLATLLASAGVLSILYQVLNWLGITNG